MQTHAGRVATTAAAVTIGLATIGLAGCSGSGGSAAQGASQGASTGRKTLTVSRAPLTFEVPGGSWEPYTDGYHGQFLIPSPEALDGKVMRIDHVDPAHHGMTIVSSRLNRMPTEETDLREWFGQPGEQVIVRKQTFTHLGEGAVVQSEGPIDGKVQITLALVVNTPDGPAAIRITASGDDRTYLSELERMLVDTLRADGTQTSGAA